MKKKKNNNYIVNQKELFLYTKSLPISKNISSI